MFFKLAVYCFGICIIQIEWNAVACRVMASGGLLPTNKASLSRAFSATWKTLHTKTVSLLI